MLECMNLSQYCYWDKVQNSSNLLSVKLFIQVNGRSKVKSFIFRFTPRKYEALFTIMREVIAGKNENIHSD